MVLINNKYELTEFIEEGGEAQILRGRRIEDEKPVVVKIYKTTNFEGLKARSGDPVHEQDPEVIGEREINVLKKATQDKRNDFPVHIDDGWVNGGIGERRFLVMEPFNSEGCTLDELIEREEFNPRPDEVVNILKQVGESIKYLHSGLGNGTKPIIHRDIKAGNVYINPDGTIILHDFSSVKHGAGITAKNTTGVGTVVYMAPEIRLSKSVSKATDVYGLGMLGKHLLLGEIFMVKDGYTTKEDFKELNLDERIIKALEKATQSDPKNRYQNVDEFVNDLESKIEIPEQARNNRKVKFDIENYSAFHYLLSWYSVLGGTMISTISRPTPPAEGLLHFPHPETRNLELLILGGLLVFSGPLALAAYKHILRPLSIGIYNQGKSLVERLGEGRSEYKQALKEVKETAKTGRGNLEEYLVRLYNVALENRGEEHVQYLKGNFTKKYRTKFEKNRLEAAKKIIRSKVKWDKDEHAEKNNFDITLKKRYTDYIRELCRIENIIFSLDIEEWVIDRYYKKPIINYINKGLDHLHDEAHEVGKVYYDPEGIISRANDLQRYAHHRKIYKEFPVIKIKDIERIVKSCFPKYLEKEFKECERKTEHGSVLPDRIKKKLDELKRMAGEFGCDYDTERANKIYERAISYEELNKIKRRNALE